jgi:hypothetical protein
MVEAHETPCRRPSLARHLSRRVPPQIVNFVPHEQRTKFWQEHLGSFLVPESGLNRSSGRSSSHHERAAGGSRPRSLNTTANPIYGRGMRGLFTREQGGNDVRHSRAAERRGLPSLPGTRLTPLA